MPIFEILETSHERRWYDVEAATKEEAIALLTEGAIDPKHSKIDYCAYACITVKKDNS